MTKVDEAHITDSLYNAAITYYTKAINIDVRFWQAYRNRARLYFRMGNVKAAIKDIETALKYTNKNDSYLHGLLGECYYEIGAYRIALKNFNIAMSDVEYIDYLLLWRAKTYWNLNLKSEACQDYLKAIKGTPYLRESREFLKCNEP